MVSLLLAGMDMLGHREIRRERDLDAHQLAIRLLGGLKKRYAYTEGAMFKDITWMSHRRLL